MPTDTDSTRVLAAEQLAADWHVPMDEALSRIDRQTAQSKLLVALASQDPKHFGGGWVDQANGGTLVLNSTDDGQADLAAFSQAAVTGSVRVDHAAMNLLAQNSLAQNVESALGGGGVVSVRVDESGGGGVDVAMLSTPGHPVAAAVRSILTKTAQGFGPSVHLVADQEAGVPLDSCTGNDCNPPLRGGTGMAMSLANTTHAYCTLGFNVISKTNSAHYELTAGHCLGDNAQPNWYGQVLDTTWHLIGQTWRAAGNYTTGVDAGIVNNADPAYWQPEAAVYVRASNDPGKATTTNYNYGIQSTPGTPGQYTYICHSGATSGTHCGMVWGPNPNGRTQVNALVCQGDSGGPVFGSGTAYGIVSGGTDSTSSMQSQYDGTTQGCYKALYMVPIQAAMTPLNVQLQ